MNIYSKMWKPGQEALGTNAITMHFVGAPFVSYHRNFSSIKELKKPKTSNFIKVPLA